MKRLDADEVLRLYLGALVGTAYLAHELEQMGIADEDDSLDEARWVRPFVLGLADRIKKTNG